MANENSDGARGVREPNHIGNRLGSDSAALAWVQKLEVRTKTNVHRLRCIMGQQSNILKMFPSDLKYARHVSLTAKNLLNFTLDIECTGFLYFMQAYNNLVHEH